MDNKATITVQSLISAPLQKVWDFYTKPEHVVKWNNASEDWHTPRAENDLRVGGKFLYRMEAKDGSVGFDFWGVYDQVKAHGLLAYTLGDERKVSVSFSESDVGVMVVVTFEAEGENTLELQQNGWQAILDNFKKYVESNQ